MSSDASTSPVVSGAAQRYAEALFDLALEEGALEKVENDLKSLAGLIAGSADFRSFLTSPVYGADEKARAVAAIAEKTELSPLTRNFLGVVAEGRKLTPDYVDSIGQGRVWVGETAKEIKLVDNLGDIDDAVAAAAKLANLTQYDRVQIRETHSPFGMIFGDVAAKAMKAMGVERSKAEATQSIVRRAIATVEKEVAFFDEFNDPKALYARCLACGN